MGEGGGTIDQHAINYTSPALLGHSPLPLDKFGVEVQVPKNIALGWMKGAISQPKQGCSLGYNLLAHAGTSVVMPRELRDLQLASEYRTSLTVPSKSAHSEFGRTNTRLCELRKDY